ncbi:DUF6884 domain-containing protein [Streptomyces diacarni]|uniref:DUF6884 domain-containing protein n=1 Tax=Streptomyces diacarni TaxID=2800381 RepID=UPI0033D25218
MTDERPDLVVISCGVKKRPHRAPAANLYTGSYFLQMKAAAQSLRATHGYRILSALHGLVEPATKLDPYNKRMGQPGSVTGDVVRAQAEATSLLGLAKVVILAGRDYMTVARAAWPDACTPLAEAPGMGYQKRLLFQIQMRGRVECTQ